MLQAPDSHRTFYYTAGKGGGNEFTLLLLAISSSYMEI